jgi:hypothetical protein
MNITTNNTAAIENREIPPLPGGGSWTFDEAAWKWVSNDPVPAEQAADAIPAAGADQSVEHASEE